MCRESNSEQLFFRSGLPNSTIDFRNSEHLLIETLGSSTYVGVSLRDLLGNAYVGGTPECFYKQMLRISKVDRGIWKSARKKKLFRIQFSTHVEIT